MAAGLAPRRLPPERELSVLGLADDPVADPWCYPGRAPAESGLLVGDHLLRVEPSGSADVGDWLVELHGEVLRLDDMLAAVGRPAIGERWPVLAVGSNASPARLRGKLGYPLARAVLPMSTADVRGVMPAVSAHVTSYGCLPATPVGLPDQESRMFVVWPCRDQLAALDETEPNYLRRPLADGVVSLTGGAALPRPCSAYVSTHGCVTDGRGAPLRLVDQRALVGGLLRELPELRGLCGDTPEEFLRRVHDVDRRTRVPGVLRGEGRVLSDPDLPVSSL